MSQPVPIVDEEGVFKAQKPSQWANRQRTLFTGSHKLSLRETHFLKDLISFTAHAKKDSKDDKDSLREQLIDSCRSKSCTNVFSVDKCGDRTVVSIARYPAGPTFRFTMANVVPASDHKFTGNALRYSRPLLSFSPEFTDLPEMKLLRHLLVDCFNAPLNHPKTQPFTDRVLSFFVDDTGAVLFRHYQITHAAKGHTELVEIGPRATLHLTRVVSGFFTGDCLYLSRGVASEGGGTAMQKERWIRKKISKKQRAEARDEHKKRLEVNEEPSSMDEFGDL